MTLSFAALFTSISHSAPADMAAHSEEKALALKGYDPVAYFVDQKASKGSEDISYVWDDSRWLFSSEENRNAFMQNPDRYKPQFDGHCVISVANGKTSVANPACFVIENERLYLLNTPRLVSLLETDLDSFVQRAEKKWPGIKEMMDDKES